MDVQSAVVDVKTAETMSRNISTCQRSMTQDSPIGLKTEMAKHPRRYNHVNDEGNNVYVPRNAPIKAPDTQDQEIVVGREEEMFSVLRSSLVRSFFLFRKDQDQDRS